MQTGSKISLATIVLLVGFAIYSVVHTQGLETRLASVESDQAKARDSFNAEVSKIRDAAAAADAERQKALDQVKQQTEAAAQRQANVAASKVKEDAVKSVNELASRVTAGETRLKESLDKA